MTAIDEVYASGDWVVDHGLQHALHQMRTRLGPERADGVRPVQRELTGLACYVCNCGEATGWVPKETLLPPGEWVQQHLDAFERTELGLP